MQTTTHAERGPRQRGAVEPHHRPGDPDDEWQLRDAAVAGDADAFALLYRRCRGTVYRYLVRRLNGDPHLADDLTSETFARALTRISSYQDMGRPFVAWLLTIAGNLAADYYKSGWRRFQVPCGDLGHEQDRATALVADLSRVTGREEVDTRVVAEQLRHHVREVLGQAMNDLTAWQQQVVRLRYVEGKSVRATAQALGTHEGAVKAATYRAVRVLARDPRLRLLKQELADGR